LLVVVAAVIHRRYMDRAASISDQLPGYERRINDHWVVMMGDRHYPVVIRPSDSGHLVICQDTEYQVDGNWQFGWPLFRGTVNGKYVCIQVERRDMFYRLFHWGSQVDIKVLTARAAELLARMPIKPPKDTSQFLLSPMPGMLVQLRVEVGQKIERGQDLAIVEAMKMENVLRAEREATISKVLATEGDTLSVDQPILQFE
ncbi:MAG: hypothetical protein KDA84_06565, partial [Planctomycetaceae bacterium]|nr:hypothetical protein [Planctomycetaceae bacterium]